MKFIFLICTERSGSNLVTSLMNAHSRVCGPPPTHLFRLFGTNRGNYGDLSVDTNWRLLGKDFELNFHAKLGAWSTTISSPQLLAQCSYRSPAELLRLTYVQEAAAAAADHVFVKENHTYQLAPFLLANFEGCQFVYMVRDPRDVASSWINTATSEGGVARAVDVWAHDQEQALLLYDQLRDSGRIIMTTYEALIRKPSEVLSILCKSAGLQFEEEMLQFHHKGQTVENSMRVGAWSNLQRPIIAGNSGKFRSGLTSVDIRYVELRCGQLMDRLGYTRLTPTPDSEEQTTREASALHSQLSSGPGLAGAEDERIRRQTRLTAIRTVLERRL